MHHNEGLKDKWEELCEGSLLSLAVSVDFGRLPADNAAVAYETS